jgi:hypothetical protein
VQVVSTSFTERYHEDLEFGIRCLKAGLVGVFDRSLLAEHAHSRSLEGALRDAENAGAGKVLVHRLHPDVMGPLDPGLFGADLPEPARSVVRGTRRPRARRAAVMLLGPLVAAASQLHLFRLELRCAQLLRRIAVQQGALRALRRPPRYP